MVRTQRSRRSMTAHDARPLRLTKARTRLDESEALLARRKPRLLERRGCCCDASTAGLRHVDDSLADVVSFAFQPGGGIRRYELTGVHTSVLFQAEDGIRDYKVTGVQTCALR